MARVLTRTQHHEWVEFVVSSPLGIFSGFPPFAEITLNPWRGGQAWVAWWLPKAPLNAMDSVTLGSIFLKTTKLQQIYLVKQGSCRSLNSLKSSGIQRVISRALESPWQKKKSLKIVNTPWKDASSDHLFRCNKKDFNWRKKIIKWSKLIY